MVARHTKRIPSQRELETRRYHKDVRNFKKWCEDNNVSYYTYENADKDFICVLSRYEFDLNEKRERCSENNEQYFLSLEDYEKWCEEG